MKIPNRINLRSKIFILLVFVLVLTTFSRLYKISSVPAGNYFDEISVGVNSYLLAHHLKDEFGNTMPDFIKIADDYRHPAIFYATAPFVRLLGLSILPIRLATASFGILIVFISFFFTYLLTKNKPISLITTFLLATSPWLTNLSRSSNEVILALFFLLLASVFFLLAQKGKKVFFPFIYLSMILAWYSYSAAILMTFMLFFFFVLYSLLSKVEKSIKYLTLVAFLLFLLFPNLFYILTQPKKITGRFDQVSVFSMKGSQLTLEEELRDDAPSNLPLSVRRIYHNKLIAYTSEISKNFSLYFSGQFLFGTEGGPPRYKIPNFGLVYFVDIPFFLIGLYFIFKRFSPEKSLLIYWLIVMVVPASLTFEDIPNIQRSIFILPAAAIISAHGIYHSLKLSAQALKKLKIAMVLLIVFFYSIFFGMFIHQLFYHQPNHQNWYRDSEWQEAVMISDKYEKQYSNVELYSTIAHYFLMFYSNNYLNNFEKESVIKDEYLTNRKLQSDWKLGKYYFRHDKCKDKKQIETDVLYSVGQGCFVPGWARVIGQAHTSDGVPMITFFDAPYSKEKLTEIKLQDKILEETGK